MKTKFKTKSKMKSLIMTALTLVVAPAFADKGFSDPQKDTVIIELDEGNKIVIITQSKEDLAALEDYDINEMIRDLNAQLSDSVEYLQIETGKVYVNEDEIELKQWKVNENEVKVKLGGLEVNVDTNEIEDWEEDDWNDRKKITYEADRVDRTTHHFNIDIGINNWLEDGNTFPDGNNAPYSVKPFGSWYVALNSINRTWVSGPIFLEWGLGVSWYNWKMQEADFAIIEQPEMIEFVAVQDPINGIKSKLTASYLNIQAVPMFDFSRGTRKVTSLESSGVRVKKYSRQGFRFGCGMYAGYRLGSHTKFRFKEDGDDQKDKESDNFFLENFRYGVRGQVGWKGVELFTMYDLNEVFAPGRGPINEEGQNARLNAITFGITL